MWSLLVLVTMPVLAFSMPDIAMDKESLLKKLDAKLKLLQPARVVQEPQNALDEEENTWKELGEKLGKYKDLLKQRAEAKEVAEDALIPERAVEESKKEKVINLPSELINKAKMTTTTEGKGLLQKLKEGLVGKDEKKEDEDIEITSECRDMDEKACKIFQPMCGIFPQKAYMICPKTCKVCKEDNPKGESKY